MPFVSGRTGSFIACVVIGKRGHREYPRTAYKLRRGAWPIPSFPSILGKPEGNGQTLPARAITN